MDEEREVAAPPELWLGPAVPAQDLRSIERNLNLRHNKWDTQVGDVATLFEHPLILSAREWRKLCRLAEQLAAETLELECAIRRSPCLRSLIGAPDSIWRALDRRRQTLDHPAARVMRFDFHPTREGWRVSEVNSDVPGGWLEGSVLPNLYRPFFDKCACPPSPLEAWGNAIETVYRGGMVALLNAPGFLEDEQVSRCFAAELEKRRIRCGMIQTPVALRASQDVSIVVRFYQAEWLCRLSRRSGWFDLLSETVLTVVNPTISAVSESKRFPLALDSLAGFQTWKTLMPECRDPATLDLRDWDDWVIKAAYSNTGDQVFFCDRLAPQVREALTRKVLPSPRQWVAQRRFETLGLESRRGTVYPCVGVFVVNGCSAGAYVRLSADRIITGAALEAPLFIQEESA